MALAACVEICGHILEMESNLLSESRPGVGEGGGLACLSISITWEFFFFGRDSQVDSKIYMEMQKGSMLPEFQIYYKAAVIETLRRDRSITNRTESVNELTRAQSPFC